MNDINRIATVDFLINSAIEKLCDSSEGHILPLFTEDERGILGDASIAIRSNDPVRCLLKLIEARKFLFGPVEIPGKGQRIEVRKLKLTCIIGDIAPVIDAAILLLRDHDHPAFKE